jgi:hypothetical protein
VDFPLPALQPASLIGMAYHNSDPFGTQTGDFARLFNFSR